MTQHTSGPAPAVPTAGSSEPPGAPSSGSQTTEVARDQAGQVGSAAADAGRHVAGTAKEQAGQVAQQARREAKDLYQQARGQAAEQARTGQRKAGDALRSLAAELHEMAGGEHHGPASDLAAQAAGRVDDLAGWLDSREPGDLVDEVRTFARRRPGLFLAGAALAGVLAGRLTRGVVDANRDTDNRGGAPRPAAGLPPAYPTGPPSGYQPPAPSYGGPGGALPPGGPLDAPRPPATGAPLFSPAGEAPPAPYPHDRDPYPTEPAAVPPRTGGPAHALRPEGTTVGEYVEDLERDDVRRGPDGRR
jgi:uncharacterized protein YjbJ (UPF0337 family)